MIDDAFELAHANRLQYAVPLGLVDTLRHEPEHQPWRTALASLSRLDSLLKNDVRYFSFWVRRAALKVHATATPDPTAPPSRRPLRSSFGSFRLFARSAPLRLSTSRKSNQ